MEIGSPPLARTFSEASKAILGSEQSMRVIWVEMALSMAWRIRET